MPAQPAVEQATPNAPDYAYDICDPIVDVGASIKVGLYEFNYAAEGRGSDEDR